MQPTNPTPMFPQGAGGASTASGRAGARAHFKKMAVQVQQLKGAGATTGGLATGPATTRVHNTAGKFYAKGTSKVK